MRLLTSLFLLLSVVLAQPPGGGPGGGPPPGGRPRGVEYVIRFGCSLGLTGVHAAASRQAMRAIQLVQETVNSNIALFGIEPGMRHRLIIDIVNDESRADRVAEIYNDFVQNDSYMAFLGPYSSELSLVAAEVTNRSGKVLMTHQASAPHLYQRGFRHLFSTNLMATDYFARGLELLYLRGARTLGLAQGTSIFHEALCDGARLHGARLGFTVLTNVSIAGSDISEGIRQIAAVNPDVLVGCGHLYNAVQIIVTSRALNFKPKAMLIAQATGDDFTGAVFAWNALYVVGPIVWTPQVEQECLVFGTAEAFNRRFLQRFGVEPNYQAAQAAAAVIALYWAVRFLWYYPDEDPIPWPEEIDFMLKTMWEPLPTALGHLNFSSVDGTRPSSKGFAVQFKQLEGNVTPLARYEQVNTQLLLDSAQLTYPSPTWEEKELEIYPCPEGSAINKDHTACVLCPAGRHRGPGSTACRICPPATYSLEAGHDACPPCISGMDCEAMRTSSTGAFVSAPGWYYVAEHNDFEECRPSWLCLGGNRCAPGHEGIFCQTCAAGYTSTGPWGKGTGECHECPHWVFNVLGILLIIFFLQLLFHVLLRSHTSSCTSLTTLHGIILRVLLNYFVLLATVVEATELLDRGGMQLFRLVIGLFLDPISFFVSLQCITQTAGRQYLMVVAIGLLLIPIVLVTSFLGVVGRDVVPLLLRHNSDEPGPFSKRDVDDELDAEAPTATSTPQVEEDGRRPSSLRRKDTVTSVVELDHAPTDVDKDAAEGMVGMHHMATEAANVLGLDVTPGQVDEALELAKQRYIARASIWIFILYPLVIRMLLTGMICDTRDRNRLAADLEVVCQSSQHIPWFRICIFGLLMYGLGLPLIVFAVLFRVRRRLLELTIRHNYGFLYNGFNSGTYFFEVVFMLRKLFIMCTLAIPTRSLRFLIMVAIGFVNLGLHVTFEPFDDRDFFVLDRLETMSLASFLLTCLANLWFAVMADEVQTDTIDSSVPLPMFARIVRSNQFDQTIGGFVSVLHVAFGLFAIWTLLRNLLFKQLRFLEECFPEQLTGTQRCFIWLVSRQWHHLKMDPDTKEIDVSQLSFDERHFLKAALSRTLSAYVWNAIRDRRLHNTDVDHHKFYIGHMLAAVRKAYKRVEFVRYRRAVAYVRQLEREEARSRRRNWTCWTRLRALLVSFSETANREMGASIRQSLRKSLGRRTLLSFIRRQDPNWSKDKKTEGTDDMGVMTAERRAQLSVQKLGITVEEMYMALMLSWSEIMQGKEEYFVLETEEDRERAFVREVMKAKGATWNQDDSVKKLFKALELRRLQREGEFPEPQEPEDEEADGYESERRRRPSDVAGVLGLSPATQEQAIWNAARDQHDTMLMEVLDLLAQKRELAQQLSRHEDPEADLTREDTFLRLATPQSPRSKVTERALSKEGTFSRLQTPQSPRLRMAERPLSKEGTQDEPASPDRVCSDLGEEDDLPEPSGEVLGNEEVAAEPDMASPARPATTASLAVQPESDGPEDAKEGPEQQSSSQPAADETAAREQAAEAPPAKEEAPERQEETPTSSPAAEGVVVVSAASQPSCPKRPGPPVPMLLGDVGLDMDDNPDPGSHMVL